jgi:glycerol-3-phosphate dehydrogenase subunit B
MSAIHISLELANLQGRWPGLAARRLTFPGMERGEIYAEVMARALGVPATRRQLAPRLVAAAGETKVIGLPALLGMHRPDLVMADLEDLTGLQMFEIPTMPPSVPGIRLRELFEQVLPQKGLALIPQQKVVSVTFDAGGDDRAPQDLRQTKIRPDRRNRCRLCAHPLP